MRKFLAVLLAASIGFLTSVKFGVVPIPEALNASMPDWLKPTSETTDSRSPSNAASTLWVPDRIGSSSIWVQAATSASPQSISNETGLYESHPIIYITHEPTKCGERNAALVDPAAEAACTEEYLLITKVEQRAADQVVKQSMFTRSGPRLFQHTESDATLTATADTDIVLIDNEVFTRPKISPNRDEYGSSDGGGGIANTDFSSKGFQINRMDPFLLQDTGTDAMLFDMHSSELQSGDRKNLWVMESGIAIPYGLKLSEIDNSCIGKSETKSAINEEEVVALAGRRVKTTVMNFSNNTAVQNKTKELRQKEENYTLSDVRCASFDLMLDKPRADITDAFRISVALAAEECEVAGDACNQSIENLVNTYGTHYPNAVTYGGLAYMETKRNGEELQLISESDKRSGNSWSQSVESSFETSVGGGVLPGENKVGLATNWTNEVNFETSSGRSASELENSIRTKTTYGTLGGNGGANFESWVSNKRDSVPISVELRPIAELLAPPFFEPDASVQNFADLLNAYLLREFAQETPLDTKSFASRGGIQIKEKEEEKEEEKLEWTGSNKIPERGYLKNGSKCVGHTPVETVSKGTFDRYYDQKIRSLTPGVFCGEDKPSCSREEAFEYVLSQRFITPFGYIAEESKVQFPNPVSCSASPITMSFQKHVTGDGVATVFIKPTGRGFSDNVGYAVARSENEALSKVTGDGPIYRWSRAAPKERILAVMWSTTFSWTRFGKGGHDFVVPYDCSNTKKECLWEIVESKGNRDKFLIRNIYNNDYLRVPWGSDKGTTLATIGKERCNPNEDGQSDREECLWSFDAR